MTGMARGGCSVSPEPRLASSRSGLCLSCVAIGAHRHIPGTGSGRAPFIGLWVSQGVGLENEFRWAPSSRPIENPGNLTRRPPGFHLGVRAAPTKGGAKYGRIRSFQVHSCGTLTTATSRGDPGFQKTSLLSQAPQLCRRYEEDRVSVLHRILLARLTAGSARS